MSVKVTAADLEPRAEGVKVTLTVQLAPEARVEGSNGQLLVCEKSPMFAPVTAMLVMFTVLVPVLVTVMVCAVLGVLNS